MKSFTTMHLSLNSLRSWHIDRKNSNVQDRNAATEEDGSVYLTIDEEAIRLTESPRLMPQLIPIQRQGRFVGLEASTRDGPSPSYLPMEGHTPDSCDFHPRATESTEIAIDRLGVQIRALEENCARDRRKVRSLEAQVIELKNHQQRRRYSIGHCGTGDDSSDSDYAPNHSSKRSRLAKRTSDTIDRLMRTVTCQGIRHKDIVEWCKEDEIHMYSSKISSFRNKKLTENTSQEMIEIIRRFLIANIGVSGPRAIHTTGKLPDDVRRCIEQCIRQMAEREMTNLDLLNWGKENGVVWNETEISSFLNEEFDELKSRQMILFLDSFIEEV